MHAVMREQYAALKPDSQGTQHDVHATDTASLPSTWAARPIETIRSSESQKVQQDI